MSVFGERLRGPCPQPSSPQCGKIMWNHVLWSLSTFNSQLTALIVAMFCSPLKPEAMIGYNSKDTAVQGPPADEAGWAAGSASAEPQCWSSQPSFANFQSFLLINAANHRYLAKTRAVFPEIPSMLSLLMLRDLSSKASHLYASDPTRVW